MKYIHIILVALFIFSCGEESLEITNLRINHYKQSAVGLAPVLVLLTQEGDKIGTDEWQYHYSGISGFDYEWGYVYDLKIKKRTIDNPPADASSIEFILEEIISKTSVEQGLTFKVQLKSSTRGIENIVILNNTSEYTLSDEHSIDCSDLCQLMAESLAREDELTGVLVHTISDEIELKELLFE